MGDIVIFFLSLILSVALHSSCPYARLSSENTIYRLHQLLPYMSPSPSVNSSCESEQVGSTVSLKKSFQLFAL